MRLGVPALWFVVASAPCVSGCGSASSGVDSNVSDASFSGLAIAAGTSTPSGWSVAMRSSPTTPVRGTNAIELVVRDATGVPVSGLGVAVVPWMPAMGHGASITPVVTAMGDGTYVATGIAMVMPGTWELRLTLTNPATGVVEHATISLSIS
jgi:hypothetical protein